MKLFKIFFVACLFTTSGFAQSTAEIYLDENGQRISKQEFNSHSKNNRGYFYLQTETENRTVFFIEKREVIGQVSPEVVKDLKNQLQNLSQSVISENSYLVVNYYPGADSCNQSGDKKTYSSRLKSYQKRINKQKEVSQFFIYKNDEGLGILNENLVWYPDANNLWQTHFFKHHYPCGSFVIVKPDGNYLLFKGEYATSQIFDGIEKLNKNP